MTDALQKLVSIGSPPLLPGWDQDDEDLVRRFGTPGAELMDVLHAKNGFYAFESALHVLPLGKSEGTLTLRYWNDPRAWRGDFGELIRKDVLFFSQDAFGYQFALDASGVFQFDPETAELKGLAMSLADWASMILEKHNFYTGYGVAHEWQQQHGRLKDGQRLIPKLPFVIGGDFAVSNLYAADAVEAMRSRASIARQIADLADGTPINMRIMKAP